MDVPIDITTTVLETDRLILRACQESDLSDFYGYASVDGVGEMAGWNHHESLEVSRSVLQSFIQDKNIFAIIHKGKNKVIGSLGIQYSWANTEPDYKNLKLKELGFVLAKEYWGQGLMPEAAKASIDFCFSECSLDALTCRHSTTNKRSKRVIEKCGFKYVKTGGFYSEPFRSTFYGMKYILFKPFS